MNRAGMYHWPRYDRRLSLQSPSTLYARSQAFHFDLEPILTDTDEPLILTPTNAEDTEMTQKLAERTSLNKGQCEALIAALTREFALIKGHPAQ